MASSGEVETGRCLCCSLVCAVLRICCFTCSRKACSCCFADPPPDKPEFSVLCLGLNGAGKTTLLTQLAGEPLAAEPEPTMGFSIKPCTVPSAILQVKELGGTEKLRPYWSMYYRNVDAIIFVVDSTVDRDGVIEARFWLHSCLMESDTKDVPVLVLYNKQDLEGAQPTQKLSHEMDIAHACKGRRYIEEQCNFRDIKGLRRTVQSLAEMVIAHKKEGVVEVNWTE